MPKKGKRGKQLWHLASCGRNAKKRKCRSIEAQKKRIQRTRMRWEQEMEAMDSLAEGISGEKGKYRTFEENKCYVLALRAYLRRRLEAGEPSINWTEIERAVAHDFMVNRYCITDLRKGFMQDGDIWVYGNGARGGPARKSTKVPQEMMTGIATMVDDVHSTGKAVVSRIVVAYILEKYAIKIHRVTAGRIMKKIGLTWSSINNQHKRSYAACRGRSIRDFIIALDKYVKDMATGTSDYVFCFTDESYVNIHHAVNKTFIPKDKTKSSTLTRKSGKGKRPILLHTITEDGPLADIDEETGKPIDELEWNRDTPHPGK